MDFEIPQPSLAGRILCCPTRPSKIKEGSFWEEPERFDAEWLKQFVRIALDVAEGVPDNASIQEKSVRATFSPSYDDGKQKLVEMATH